MKYKELKRFYSENFGLGHLNPPPDGDYSPFEQKLILLSLICYVVEKNKAKNPDITHGRSGCLPPPHRISRRPVM